MCFSGLAWIVPVLFLNLAVDYISLQQLHALCVLERQSVIDYSCIYVPYCIIWEQQLTLALVALTSNLEMACAETTCYKDNFQ